jgi:uncharacterized membrane protein YphA (DoxX/SURF4 family)
VFLLLLILLILLLAGSGPWFPYGRPYGYYPFGVILLVLLLFLVFSYAGAFATDWRTLAADLPDAGAAGCRRPPPVPGPFQEVNR